MTSELPDLEALLAPPSESRGALTMRERVAANLGLELERPRQQLARYHVLRCIGTGGMGVVYEGYDPELDRNVAIKLLRRQLVHERGRERLLEEARVLAKLSHPNVVAIFEVGTSDEDVYLVMELVEGDTLESWQRGERELSALLDAYAQAGAGLRAAHELGIVHRDFKPTNVLMGSDGRVRVIDFGLALEPSTQSSEPQLTRSDEGPPVTRGVAGTRGYIAPECAAGQRADARSDQFSFCIALWEAVAGVRLGSDEAPSHFPGPAWLRKALLRGLSPEPQRRWPDMSSLLNTLDLRRRQLRRKVAGILTLGLCTGALTTLLVGNLYEPCPDPSPDYAAVWHPEQPVLTATRLPTESGSWLKHARARTRTVLSEHRRRWISTANQVCRDAHEGSRTTSARDAAQECLAGQLGQVATLLAQLDSADAEVLLRLEHQLGALDDPRACASSSMLARFEDEGPETLAARDELGRIELLVAAGHYDAAQQAVDVLLTRTRGLGDPALIASCMELQGELLVTKYEFEAAATHAPLAAHAAERAADDELLFWVRWRTARLYAAELEQPDEARIWLDASDATFDRLDQAPHLRPALTLAHADLDRAEGRLAEAETKLREVLRELPAYAPTRALGLATVQLTLANVIADQGRTAQAAELYAAFARERAATLGPQHPEVGMAAFDLAMLHMRDGELELAQVQAQRAHEIQVQVFGPDSIRLAPALTLLGELAYIDGDWEQAIELGQRASLLQLRELPRGHSERTGGLALLAAAELFSGRYEAALFDYRRLSELATELDSEDQASARQSIGWLLCRLGRCAEARAEFEAALALTSDATTLAYARAGLVDVELSTGDPRRAYALLEQVESEAEAWLADDPEFAAELAWLETRALLDTQGSPSAIEDAFARARAGYADLPRPDIHASLELLALRIGAQ